MSNVRVTMDACRPAVRPRQSKPKSLISIDSSYSEQQSTGVSRSCLCDVLPEKAQGSSPGLRLRGLAAVQEEHEGGSVDKEREEEGGGAVLVEVAAPSQRRGGVS